MGEIHILTTSLWFANRYPILALEGHKYQIVNHPNGCCDCGDHEVWDKEGFCPAHQGFDEAKEPALAALP